MTEEQEREERLDDELVAVDDTVILRALKVSAVALAAILALIAVLYFVLRPEKIEQEIDEKPIVLPEVQAVEALSLIHI